MNDPKLTVTGLTNLEIRELESALEGQSDVSLERVSFDTGGRFNDAAAVGLTIALSAATIPVLVAIFGRPGRSESTKLEIDVERDDEKIRVRFEQSSSEKEAVKAELIQGVAEALGTSVESLMKSLGVK